MIMRADAGCEHRVPAPQGLLPERLRPREIAILDHPLVAAPHIVDQDVDTLGLGKDFLERGFDLRVLTVVTTNRRCLLVDQLVIRRRSPGDENSRAVLRELSRHAASDALGGAGHDADSTL